MEASGEKNSFTTDFWKVSIFSTYSGKSYSRDGKEIFLKDGDTSGKVGQCKYIAIVDSEGSGKKKKDSEHKEISLTIDMPEDLIVHQNKDY